jgi:GNAT superfamily N-acetyltransferase
MKTPQTLDLNWQLKKATNADVEATAAVPGHPVNSRRQEVLRDKLKRYARKPDRDFFIAVNGETVLGFTCVMEERDVPIYLPLSTKKFLRSFACSTVLVVRPDFRGRGIGGGLVRCWEQWARERGRSGVWLVTHRMARWYRQCFGFEAVGRIRVKNVEKMVMAKSWFLDRIKGAPDFFSPPETREDSTN